MITITGGTPVLGMRTRHLHLHLHHHLGTPLQTNMQQKNDERSQYPCDPVRCSI